MAESSDCPLCGGDLEEQPDCLGRTLTEGIPCGDGTYIVGIEFLPLDRIALHCAPCDQTFYLKTS